MSSVRLGKLMFLLAGFTLFLVSCGQDRSALVTIVANLTTGRYRDDTPSVEKIAQWEDEIRKYEKRIEENIDAVGQIASFYKLIGEEYTDLQMYGPALESFRQVLAIEPANHLVLYRAGVASAQIALANAEAIPRNEGLHQAEYYYERALEISPGYVEAYRALAVLYVYELENLEKGKEITDRGLNLYPDDTRLLFVSAALAVMDGRNSAAIEIYDRIAGIARNPAEKDAAIENREALSSGQ